MVQVVPLPGRFGWLAAAIEPADLQAWQQALAQAGVRLVHVELALLDDLQAIAGHVGDDAVIAVLRDEGMTLLRVAGGTLEELIWDRCDTRAQRLVEQRLLAFQGGIHSSSPEPLWLVCRSAAQCELGNGLRAATSGRCFARSRGAAGRGGLACGEPWHEAAAPPGLPGPCAAPWAGIALVHASLPWRWSPPRVGWQLQQRQPRPRSPHPRAAERLASAASRRRPTPSVRALAQIAGVAAQLAAPWSDLLATFEQHGENRHRIAQARARCPAGCACASRPRPATTRRCSTTCAALESDPRLSRRALLNHQVERRDARQPCASHPGGMAARRGAVAKEVA